MWATLLPPNHSPWEFNLTLLKAMGIFHDFTCCSIKCARAEMGWAYRPQRMHFSPWSSLRNLILTQAHPPPKFPSRNINKKASVVLKQIDL